MSFVQTATPAQTQGMGASLADRLRLRPEWGRIVLISGELGAGKTTFVQGLLTKFGIEAGGQSPTFTFFREYQAEGERLLHADLYRLSETHPAQRSALLLEQLSTAAEQDAFLLIEWADLLTPREVSEFFPENRIHVHFERGNTENERRIQVVFQNSGSISEAETLALMEEFKTPIHIRRHIEGVTAVAARIADELFSAGIMIDQDLVKCGALCHDLVRYVDFRDFDDHSKFEEEVTPEKLALWTKVRDQYQEEHHAAAISDILRRRGFYATAKVTEAHHTTEIFREEPFSWEEKVVYYADKRVLHDRVVSLADRFEDGRRRYAHESNPELEARVFELEREIFEPLPIRPKDIV